MRNLFLIGLATLTCCSQPSLESMVRTAYPEGEVVDQWYHKGAICGHIRAKPGGMIEATYASPGEQIRFEPEIGSSTRTAFLRSFRRACYP